MVFFVTMYGAGPEFDTPVLDPVNVRHYHRTLIGRPRQCASQVKYF